jgi:hypothetical protein
MAVLVLLLSLYPCTDGDDHSHHHHDTSESGLTIVTHSHQGAHIEHCSPLCHCDCCHTFVTVHNLDLVPMLANLDLKPFSLLDDQIKSEHIQTILQPPIA